MMHKGLNTFMVGALLITTCHGMNLKQNDDSDHGINRNTVAARRAFFEQQSTQYASPIKREQMGINLPALSQYKDLETYVKSISDKLNSYHFSSYFDERAKVENKKIQKELSGVSYEQLSELYDKFYLGGLHEIVFDAIKSVRNRKEINLSPAFYYQNLESYVKITNEQLNCVGLSYNEKRANSISNQIKEELSNASYKELCGFLNFKDLNKIIHVVIEDLKETKKPKLTNQQYNTLQEEKGKNLQTQLSSLNGQTSPHVSLEYSEPMNNKLELGVNLFYATGDSCTFEYIYGPKILERQNSSGNNNCCLLFSMIGEDADLYAKVMGISVLEAQQFLKDHPELANEIPESLEDKLKNAELIASLSGHSVEEIKKEMTDNHKDMAHRRSFVHVREKFFNDIIEHLDDKIITTEARNKFTVREFLDYNFKKSPYIKEIFQKTNESYRGTLNQLHQDDKSLDSFFATIFGCLYDKKIVVLNGTFGQSKLYDVHMGDRNLNPYITKEDVPNLIYVYIGGTRGGHYQKLKVIDIG